MKFLAFIFVVVLMALLNAFVLMVAWNYVVPYLFKLPELGLLQSLALVVVANVLVKGTIATADYKSK